MQPFPTLKGDALQAVQYREGHLQIIASAGSGKTEVVAQRVAGLLAERIPPDAMVAFTFTERAAASLKSRIEQRAAAKLGQDILDSLNGMSVGPVHSYCFRILQQHVARYETFDVLDDHRLTAFLTREFYNLGLPSLGSGMFSQIRRFGKNVQVVENELLEPHQLTDPFREVYERYVASLEEHRFLTYGQIIARAVHELRDPEVFASVHGPLRHLIVDEYQDINPAQESLIKRLAEPPVQLCVVGDDDQAIYQWRGSDVENILEFEHRYKKVREFRIERNRRSRPEIIRVANRFARSIEPRLRKTMKEFRPDSGRTEVVCWTAERPEDEAERIARVIKTAHDLHGYRDVAVLCRGRVSFPAILEALSAEDIPLQPGGRTFLFTQEDADLFGRTICWLAGYNWRVGHYGWNEEPVTLDDLLARYTARFGLDRSRRAAVRR